MGIYNLKSLPGPRGPIFIYIPLQLGIVPITSSCRTHGHPSGLWRRAEVSIPIPSLVPLVFKTRLRAGAINPPNKKWGISTPHKHLLMAIAFAIFATLTVAVVLLFGKNGRQTI